MQTELEDIVRETLDIPMNRPSRAYQAVHSHGKHTTASKQHEACPQEPEPEASGQKPPTTKRCEPADRATVTLHATGRRRVTSIDSRHALCREQQVRHRTLLLVIYGLLHNIRTHLVTQSAAAGRLAASTARVNDIRNEHLATAVPHEMCRDRVFLLV